MSRTIVIQFSKAVLFVIFMIISDRLLAQPTDFSYVKNQFEKYRQQVLEEKIYVHTDKDFYLAGEILWFKLYNVDAGLHKPLDISKVAYVEILDKDYKPLIQSKTGLQKGSGKGSFVLPPDLSSGNYIFRAYTNWMKNFDPDFYFEKTIIIVNTLKTEPLNTSKSFSNNYDIQFFPEGGNLVNGIESTLGFRTVDQYGRGSDVNGIIVDQDNDTILNFSSEKFGVGSFQFLPENGKHYRAVITLADGSSLSKELPGAFEQGYVLHLVKTGNGKIQVTIQTNGDLNSQNVYLFVHSKQQIVEARSAVINNNKVELSIDETQLGDGISHFTLFNNVRQPVCERLYFKRPAKLLSINAAANQHQYESRKKVTIDINTKDEKGGAQKADMSIAVYRLDSLGNSEENIFSYLWLSSDLKGKVESADYYFTHTGPDGDRALDNLMLTHGWRRFKWEAILQDKTPQFLFIPEYEGHIVSGIVRNKETGRPAKGILSYLSIPGLQFKFYAAQSNDSGSVLFYTKDFYGPQEMFAQAGGRERNFIIDVKSPFSESYSSKIPSPFSLSEVSGQQLLSNGVNMQVRNIYAGEKMNKVSFPLTDTSSFYSIATNTYLLDNYVRFPTMEEVLREYVREIAVMKQNNNLVLEAGRRDAAGIVYRYEPLVMLDGVPLFDDPNKIFGYDPLKVKELQIVNRKYFLGPATFEGIINFRTYTGRPEGLLIDQNATVLDYEGLQLHMEFYSPVYETQNQLNSRLPDYRNLLYWSPEVKTNSSGATQLNFYTSDQPGKYLVTIQGLSADGRAGSTSFTMEVVNPLFVQQ